VTAVPPSDAGGPKLTLACPFPGAADSAVGGPGGPSGVTGEEAAEAGPVPTAFVAVTVNV
jgi:hypothetical protein